MALDEPHHHHHGEALRLQSHPMSFECPEYWKNVYAQCSSLKEMEDLFSTCGISISYMREPLRLKSTAGTILQGCLTQIDRFRNQMTRSLCVYKVGITTNPVLRFHFYARGNYSKMSLLHITENMGVAQMLEAALLAMHISEKECRNERFGGDGPATLDHMGPHFLYIVGARADCGKPIS